MNYSTKFHNSEPTGGLNRLKPSLVCPGCKQKLYYSDKYNWCSACGESFPQVSKNWINLFSEKLLKDDQKWASRQQEMEIWYQNLIVSPKQASYCLLNDYVPFEPTLNSMSGKVLDVGGGVGLVRHYLPSNTQYIVLDPSLDWLKIEWKTLSDIFPCLATPPSFVRGVGECLPFSNCSFDVVLSFWSINHTSNPKQVFEEMERVLQPGGKLFIVFEDMSPIWSDIIDKKFPAEKVFLSFFGIDKEASKFARSKLMARLLLGLKFPLQPDHIRIEENDVFNWSKDGFELIERSWIGQFLALEFKKNSLCK
ncbi:MULTISPECIES: class I SAM-dependent methyltransferase [Cyanophyceae]|uniref:class I SAM-dependent methyltransferase n=1 Tax=Cyanophyceae TaxID=3028117 RepID=UPI001683D38B|nr:MULTISPECIES: class I SAM-dependent methyltransferase [Cyanophyceae]MBD1918185.1 class I SAM-dependent methyltransferase [Phormidium sp. FACHB-77]MBD2030217.1 class I SAM-dependent methyltransferase [Phormidium sp. FACHB-322]MBD2051411.1 class I SAM-dependent methyltransferase [Leptolyngbya sp. FACHB-60]